MGKKYESLLLSSSAIHLFSRGYSGTTLALIPSRVRRLFQVGETDLPHKTYEKKPGQILTLSGATVPVSGVWQPNHDDCANVAELWLKKGAFFPHCSCCGQFATFTLVEEITHISEDPDFQEEK